MASEETRLLWRGVDETAFARDGRTAVTAPRCQCRVYKRVIFILGAIIICMMITALVILEVPSIRKSAAGDKTGGVGIKTAASDKSAGTSPHINQQLFCPPNDKLSARMSTTAPIAHVFLIIGQSNAVGRNHEGLTLEDVTYDDILQTSCCTNGQTTNDKCEIITGQDPLHHKCDQEYLDGSGVGFGMTFSREFRVTMPDGDIIVLVPAAITNTGFVDGVWTAYTGTGFLQALKRLQNTFQLIGSKYPHHIATLDGILWHQGEKDTGKVNFNDHLKNNLIPMINAWRDVELIPQSGGSVPFLVGNLVPEWINKQNSTQSLFVPAALQFVSQSVLYVGVAPSIGLQPTDDNCVHFSAQSQRALGRRYFAAYKAAILNGPERTQKESPQCIYRQ